MKKLYTKIISIILAAAIIIGIVPITGTQAQAAKRPSVQASAYVVTDGISGNNIYKKNMDKKIYPASTAKLMTALVAIENASLNKKIKMTKKIKNQLPWDAAKLSLNNGAKYTVNQYVHMLLICSDAGSAVALAMGISGSIEKFSLLMNKKAAALGMTKTKFDNPVGLDIGNGYKNTYTTASDFAKLATIVMKNKTIRNIVKKQTYTVKKVKGSSSSFTIRNTNKFYSTYKVNNGVYTIIGTKTGTTNAAGRTLIATAKDKQGHEVIVSYFGAQSTDNLYTGIRKLFDYTFKQYKKGKIVLAS